MRRTAMLLLVGTIAAVAIAPSSPAPPVPQDAVRDTVATGHPRGPLPIDGTVTAPIDTPVAILSELTLVSSVAPLAVVGVAHATFVAEVARACAVTSIERATAINDSIALRASRNTSGALGVGRHRSSCHRVTMHRSTPRTSRSSLVSS